MKSKRQIRFKTEEEILKAIDFANSTASNCLKCAVNLDAQRHAGYKEIAEAETVLVGLKPGARHDEARRKIHDLKTRCEQLKKDAERLSKRRISIENNKLPKLATALAQFRTRLMEPITTDPAVVI